MSEEPKVSMGTLFARFSSQISTLFRAEVALAKAQAKQAGTRFGMAAALFALAGIFALFMLGWLIKAMFFAWLNLTGLDWAAALLTALVLGVLAGIFAWAGVAGVKRAMSHIPAPAAGMRTDVGILKSAFKSDSGKAEPPSLTQAPSLAQAPSIQEENHV